MRVIRCLMGVLLAASTSGAGADGSHPCTRTGICRIEIKVDKSTTPCTAKAPEITVTRIADNVPTLLLFYIDNRHSGAEFDSPDGVKVSQGGGDHFEHLGRSSARIFLVIDKNRANGDFPYEFKVSNDGRPCDPKDPMILNRN